jgi:hypothetical protein
MANKLVDNLIAMKILKMLVTPFKDTEAYKLGIVDENGKLLRRVATFTKEQEFDSYNYLTRFVFNIKRLLNKIGKENMLKSLAAAIYLIKEHEELIAKDLSEEQLEDMMHFVCENKLYVNESADVEKFLFEDGECGCTTTTAIPHEADGVGKDMTTPAISSKNKYKKKVIRRSMPVEQQSK